MKLSRENTLAVCIDYQEKLMPSIHEGEQVLQRAEILVRGLRALGVPVGTFRTVGETVPFAYLLPLRDDCERPEYFALALN